MNKKHIILMMSLVSGSICAMDNNMDNNDDGDKTPTTPVFPKTPTTPKPSPKTPSNQIASNSNQPTIPPTTPSMMHGNPNPNLPGGVGLNLLTFDDITEQITITPSKPAAVDQYLASTPFLFLSPSQSGNGNNNLNNLLNLSTYNNNNLPVNGGFGSVQSSTIFGTTGLLNNPMNNPNNLGFSNNLMDIEEDDENASTEDSDARSTHSVSTVTYHGDDYNGDIGNMKDLE